MYFRYVLFIIVLGILKAQEDKNKGRRIRHQAALLNNHCIKYQFIVPQKHYCLFFARFVIFVHFKYQSNLCRE